MKRLLASAIVVTLSLSCTNDGGDLVDAPRIWNDRDLADWATPVAGLNRRPDHFSEAEYYAAPPAEFVRTYPVYFPGREPDGYWQMLQSRQPEPIITRGARSRDEWIAAGSRAFEEMDVPAFRSRDAGIIATVRSRSAFEQLGGHPQADGTVAGMRWVPTREGLASASATAPAATPAICPTAHACRARRTTTLATG